MRSKYPAIRSRLLATGVAQMAALVVLAIVANVVVELSVVAVLLVLIVSLTFRPHSARMRRVFLALAVGSGISCAIGLVRFTLTKAMSGIAEGGQRAASKSALWRLREILLAEDGLRKEGIVDSDGDGIGEAELIHVLAGIAPTRDGAVLNPPPLNYRFREGVETAAGPAVRVASHLMIVCLPKKDGGWTTGDESAVDPEAAERRFVAYAWPDDGAPDVHDVWFIDEHENILLLPAGEHTYRGRERPPPCTAAISAKNGAWERWKDKQPRRRLPGDRTR